MRFCRQPGIDHKSASGTVPGAVATGRCQPGRYRSWYRTGSIALTSSKVGKLGCAPLRVTEQAAAAVAHSPASNSDCPAEMAKAKAALNASPAAVVSTAATGKAGQNSS